MSFRLKSNSRLQYLSFLWGRLTQNLGYVVQTPKRHFLARNDAFWALIGPDRMHSATCGLGKETKKEKKDSGKLAIRPDHPRRRIDVKICLPCGLRCVVLYISSFIKIGPVVLPLWVVENRPFPLLGHWLIQQLVYRTSRDNLLVYRSWNHSGTSCGTSLVVCSSNHFSILHRFRDITTSLLH